MDEVKKQHLFLQDGRRAEKVTQEANVDGETRTVTEVWAEPKVDMRLTQRVSEFTKPVVCRRVIENVDELTGEVIEQKIESIEPEVKMQLREHLQSQDTVAALGVKEDDCNCYVTREDMMEGFLAVAKALKTEEEEPKVSLQSVVGEKIENISKNSNTKNMLTWGAIAIMMGALAFVVFLM